MTTTTLRLYRPSIALYFLPALFLLLFFSSCKKDEKPNNDGPHASSYSSEVLDKWMTLQLRLMRNATGIPNQGFSRHYAYSGVAALEALAPGLPGGEKWRAKWNDLTSLPASGKAKNYYLPANVNAAMATINKAMFQNASAADKAAIDSLEATLKTHFLTTQSTTLIDASEQFGRAVATAVFNWGETDGYKQANNPYTVPVGLGLWKPTPPTFAPPSTPYWGQNRTIVYRSTLGAGAPSPTSYSTDPASSFYVMVKEVYEASQALTDDQKAAAIFWRDVPGQTSPGHWLSILQQVVRNDASTLDKGALAYALTGIAINDALIACFESKYQYNTVRPITYIREVLGHTGWNSFLGNPAHPEYVSAHAALSAAAAKVLEQLFTKKTPFIDHTYDYMGLAPRTYTSYTAIGEEAGYSRLYAGIHYRPSIQAGLTQGIKVADNILSESK